jgi:hypothetical protein
MTRSDLEHDIEQLRELQAKAAEENEALKARIAKLENPEPPKRVNWSPPDYTAGMGLSADQMGLTPISARQAAEINKTPNPRLPLASAVSHGKGPGGNFVEEARLPHPMDSDAGKRLDADLARMK